MLKSNLNYPYPLLRSDCIDYKTSSINSNIYLEYTDTSYIIKYDITTDNDLINDLIDKKKLKKGILIESKSVWFRKFYDSDNGTIEIPAKDIYGHVTFTVCIIAVENISNFYSDDFVDDYLSIENNSIKINRGEIVAVGKELSTEALLENDIFNNVSSIFQFNETDDKYVKYDATGDLITIYLPKDIHYYYHNISRGYKSLNTVLNSMLIVPVIVDILNDFGEHYGSENKWYLTLDKALEKNRVLVNDDGTIDNALEVAQILTDGLLNDSLLAINKCIHDDGDE